MKRIVLTTVILLSFKLILCQEFRNYYGIDMSGDISMHYIKSDAPEPDEQYVKVGSYQLGANPFYGYLFNKFLLGVGVGIGFYHMDTPYAIEEPTIMGGTTYQIYPLVRYYSQHGLFLHFQFSIGKEIYKVVFPDQYIDLGNLSYTSYAFLTGIGYSIKAGDNFLIEPQFRIYYHKLSGLEFEMSPLDSKNIGCQFTIGFVYKN